MVTPNQKTWTRHMQRHEGANPSVSDEQYALMESLGLKPRWTRRGEYCEAFDPREGRRVSIAYAAYANNLINAVNK